MRSIINVIFLALLGVSFAQEPQTSTSLSENGIKSDGKAQDFYVSFGKSITNYDYRNSKNMPNENLKPSMGNIYEIGLKNIYNVRNIEFGLEIELIDYNSIGNNDTTKFEWNTSYLGINTFGQGFLKIFDNIEIGFDFGFGLQHILSGEQVIGNQIYDLKSNNEFDGLFRNLKLTTGLNIISNNNLNAGVYIGYNNSTSLDNNSVEKLNFSAFHFKIKLCTK